MRITLAFFLIFCFGIQSNAQENIAVIKKQFPSGMPVSEEIATNIHAHLNEHSNVKHMGYSDESSLLFLPEVSSSAEESACSYVLFYHFDVYETYTPKLNVIRDTTKKIVSVNFQLNPGAFVHAKMIDITTNEIVGMVRASIKEAISVTGESGNTMGKKGRYEIKDYKKYFGSNPELLKSRKPDEYNKAINHFHKIFRDDFRAFFRGKSKQIVSRVAACEGSRFLSNIIPVVDVETEKEKAKKVHLILSGEAKVGRLTSFRIFTLDTLNEFVFSNKLGLYSVKEVNENAYMLTGGLAGKAKKTGQAFLAGKQLYASLNWNGFSKKLNAKMNPIVVGTDFGFKAVSELEMKFMDIENVRLVDLAMVDFIDQFRNRYKQEQFIDQNIEVQPLGAEYLLIVKGEDTQITDVESGAILFSYPSSEGFKGMYDAAMEMFDLEMEIVEITKQKKNKINAIRLYSPLGLSAEYTFNIFEIFEEKVGSEMKERAIEIGYCRGTYGSDGTVAEFKIAKGEKELFEAVQKGSKLRFRNKEWKFLGRKFK